MPDVGLESRERYRIHGLSVEVACEERDASEAVALVFGYFGLERDSAPSSPPDVRLCFWSPRGGPDIHLPVGPPAHVHNGVAVWPGEERVFLGEGESAVVLEFMAGVATGILAAPLWERPGILRLGTVNLIIHSLLLLLRGRGYFPLHGAGLSYRGAGLLLVGASDSGKSTQAMGLVQAGWQYLSDDSLLLRADPSGVEARPLRRDFGLDEETAALFWAEGEHLAPFISDERKGRIDLRTRYPAQAAERCRPRVLLFPSIVPRPDSELVPLSRAEAIIGLLQQSPLLAAHPRIAADHVRVLRTLVNQTRAYRLFAGEDLWQEPANLAGLLGPAMAANVGDTLVDTDYTMNDNRQTLYTVMGDGTAVLLNLETGRYYTLNETGKRIWELLREGRSADDVASSMAAEYTITRADALPHVLALVAEFQREGMLTG